MTPLRMNPAKHRYVEADMKYVRNYPRFDTKSAKKYTDTKGLVREKPTFDTTVFRCFDRIMTVALC